MRHQPRPKRPYSQAQLGPAFFCPPPTAGTFADPTSAFFSFFFSPSARTGHIFQKANVKSPEEIKTILRTIIVVSTSPVDEPEIWYEYRNSCPVVRASRTNSLTAIVTDPALRDRQDLSLVSAYVVFAKHDNSSYAKSLVELLLVYDLLHSRFNSRAERTVNILGYCAPGDPRIQTALKAAREAEVAHR